MHIHLSHTNQPLIDRIYSYLLLVEIIFCLARPYLQSYKVSGVTDTDVCGRVYMVKIAL